MRKTKKIDAGRNGEYIICEKTAEFDSYGEIHVGCVFFLDPGIYENEIVCKCADKNEAMRNLMGSPSIIVKNNDSYTVTEKVAIELKKNHSGKYRNITVLGFSYMPTQE